MGAAWTKLLQTRHPCLAEEGTMAVVPGTGWPRELGAARGGRLPLTLLLTACLQREPASANRATKKHLHYCCSTSFHTSKAIKRATGCIRTEELICGCFSPSRFQFVGSSHTKPLACLMGLSRVVNLCQQLWSCKTTTLLDALCNSGPHIYPPCCLCLYLKQL